MPFKGLIGGEKSMLFSKLDGVLYKWRSFNILICLETSHEVSGMAF